MYLKRSLIKRQAKELIRGNVFKLFIISLAVSLCVYLVSGVMSGISTYNTFSNLYEFYRSFSEADSVEDFFENYFDGYFGDYFGDYFDDYFDEYFDGHSDGIDDSNYFDGFGDDGWDFHNFGGELNLIPSGNEAESGAFRGFRINFFSSFPSLPFIITVALAPLAVTLAGLYVSFIRGRRYELEEGIKSVFVDAFKVNYLKKLGVNLFRTIITALLSALFVIPGIIFSYSSYFAFQIMCDYPGLTAWEAIKLSKKIIKGNRFELFLMNLSFLPWAFLCIFIFPIIYVAPYFETTNALYYENFRLRAIKEGRVTEDDFLSDAQRCAKYGAMGNNQYNSFNSAQQGTYYHTPQQPQQPQYGAQNYSAPYQPYQPVENQPYGTAPSQSYGTAPNQPYGTAPSQPYGTAANQPYAPAPNTPPAQPQAPVEPQEPTVNEYEAPKPAEPTDYPWEGK